VPVCACASLWLQAAPSTSSRCPAHPLTHSQQSNVCSRGQRAGRVMGALSAGAVRQCPRNHRFHCLLQAVGHCYSCAYPLPSAPCMSHGPSYDCCNYHNRLWTCVCTQALPLPDSRWHWASTRLLPCPLPSLPTTWPGTGTRATARPRWQRAPSWPPRLKCLSLERRATALSRLRPTRHHAVSCGSLASPGLPLGCLAHFGPHWSPSSYSD
jgi:hypothetical protein